jgi:hypothetical protein
MAMTVQMRALSIRPLIVAIVMLGSLFVATRWTEILSARFEFQPVMPSYTALCARAERHDLKFLNSLCRRADSSNEQSSNQ